jgi:hypothetical protein
MILPIMSSLGRRAFLAFAVFLVASRRPVAAPVTIDEFMELSERLLGRRGLDRDAGEAFLRAINADADSAVTLAYLVQSNGNPTPEQRALSARIVAWWSTGIYTMNGKRYIASHPGSLKWTAWGLSAPWFRGW